MHIINLTEFEDQVFLIFGTKESPRTLTVSVETLNEIIIGGLDKNFSENTFTTVLYEEM